MRTWLAQRLRWAGKKDSPPAPRRRSTGNAMSKNAMSKTIGIESIEQLENMVKGRVKTFLRHTWMVTILGTLVLVGVIWLTVYMTTKPTVMKIAVGPPGGVDAKLVELLRDKFIHERDKIQLELVPTEGPTQSAEALAGRAELAVVRGDATSPDLPVVAILRQNVVVFAVPASAPAARKGKRGKAAKIEKISQLPGHRLGIVTGNDASLEVLKVVLGHYGVRADKLVLKGTETTTEPAPVAIKPAATDKAAVAKAAAEKAAAAKAAAATVQISLIDPKDIAAAIRDNQADVLFVAGPASGHAIAEVVAAATNNGAAPDFLEIDQADAIAKRLPFFESVEIDTGTFSGNPPAPDDSFKTLSFPQYIVARRSFNEDRIATLARLIYTSRLSLAEGMPGEVKIESPSTDKDAPIMVHRGTIAYLNDDQKTFFDRYGDQIFYGMLVFPVIGSMIAGVAGYFRADTRTRRLRLLKRLLDLTKKAHEVPSIEALNQLQIETDNLVLAVIHQTEREEFDDAARMSFSLAIEQARFSIAARRVVLLERGPATAAVAA
jgi:TRAP-type uncharacterized transport system substrate-binding protein